jgi:hypothetical protein
MVMDLATDYLAHQLHHHDAFAAEAAHEHRRRHAERRAEASAAPVAARASRGARFKWMPRGWRHA